MSGNHITNVEASVKQKLLNIHRDKGGDFNYTLTRYGVERFLYRLANSKYRDKMILKGAMSFHVWSDLDHRPTRDADFLGFGEDDAVMIELMIKEIISAEVEEDGLIFNPDTIRVEDIREGGQYHGKRVTLLAKLGNSRVPIQIDIGFGDKVTPRAKIERFPPLLDMDIPKIRVYPRESVVAEKFEAIVKHGMTNSRLKDYFDLMFIADTYQFGFMLLRSAVLNTFRQRNTDVPENVPIGMSDEYAADSLSNKRWNGFLRKTRLNITLDLKEVIEHLRTFLLPLTISENTINKWEPGGPWQ